VGLRRREGVDLPRLAAQAALRPGAIVALEQRWQPFVAQGLLLREGPRWRLSDPEGLALSNAVLRELLAWWEEQGSGAEDPPPSR
jgi:coproporphyrinogen III oxidase-like Fe-S oxidoreductase